MLNLLMRILYVLTIVVSIAYLFSGDIPRAIYFLLLVHILLNE